MAIDYGKAMLVDTTRCMACRGCQVACKQWNDLPAEKTKYFGCEPSGSDWCGTYNEPTCNPNMVPTVGPAPTPPTQVSGYQNPLDLSFITYTLVRFFSDGDVWRDRCVGNNPGCTGARQWNFLKWGCFHCGDPCCVEVCDVSGHSGIDGQYTKAMRIDPVTGFVWIDKTICSGCMTCAVEPGCPWNIPKHGLLKLEGEGPLLQKASKCHGCVDPLCNGCVSRVSSQYPLTANPGRDDPIRNDSLIGADLIPACVTACPNGALQYGDYNPIKAAAIARAGDANALADYPDGLYVFGLGNYGEPETRVIMVLTEDPDWYIAAPPQVTVMPNGWVYNLADLVRTC